MKNIRFTIEYEGTGYSGWQRQKGQLSIQGIIENAVAQVTGEKVTLYGSGRTDAGVHALGQVANFFSDSKLSADKLMRAVNAKLPRDIVIKGAREVSASFNAQKSAKGKTYLYRICNAAQRPALLRNFVAFYPEKLDVQKMKAAAQVLKGEHDFRAFCSMSSKIQNCVRKISKLNIAKRDDEIHITVTADGFLYNMVRSIVGTLLLVGRGKLTVEAVKKILALKNRSNAGPTAPARGLYLVEVRY